jgi:hypothetical protein
MLELAGTDNLTSTSSNAGGISASSLSFLRSCDRWVSLVVADSNNNRVLVWSALLLPRWNASAEDVQKSVAQLVLALVEFPRELLERQAIRQSRDRSPRCHR